MMLYDPKWERQAETKADPFKLETLIAWLEQQPADETYCYLDNGKCLLAQYLTAHGFEGVRVAAFGGFSHESGGRAVYATMPECMDTEIAWGGKDARRTFGAALARAREHQGSI